MAPAPAPRTEAVLVGPLCQGDKCLCRSSDGDAGSPDSSHKRYEVRIGPSDDPLWVTVDDMVLFKSRERADACFYIDLQPGEHPVAIRGKGIDGGLSVAVQIAEQGGKDSATWWYDTFDFNCGSPGQCTLDTVREWRSRIESLAGKHDPCGSTKIEKIQWETGRMPDRVHPDDLLVKFALNVYQFTPGERPGCKDEAPAQ